MHRAVRRRWTEQEDAILAREYPSGGLTACIPLLPNRSPLAIVVRVESSKPTPSLLSDETWAAWLAELRPACACCARVTHITDTMNIAGRRICKACVMAANRRAV